MPRKSGLGHVTQGLDKDLEPITAVSMAEANVSVFGARKATDWLKAEGRAGERAHADAPRLPGAAAGARRAAEQLRGKS